MRVLRITVTAIFIVVSVIFSIFYIGEKLNTDTTVPIIKIDEQLLEVSFDADDAELLKGVTAYDGKDGDLTDRIIVQSVSKFIDDGICKVTYAVCDSNNNVSTATRKIQYKDYFSPRFSMSRSTCYSIYEGVSISQAIQAYDCIDGDISRSIIVTSEDFTSSVAGVFKLDVSVTNSKGDTSIINIPLVVEDRNISAPEIELKEYLVYTGVGKSVDFSEYLVRAEDYSGADITSSVRIEENVDFSTPGTYSVHYYVADYKGVQGHTILNVIVG